jgi:hypothetical protein
MKDLSVDKKKPWTGPGRDPRDDRYQNQEEEEENLDADDGDETYLDPRTSYGFMFIPTNNQ